MASGPDKTPTRIAGMFDSIAPLAPVMAMVMERIAAPSS